MCSRTAYPIRHNVLRHLRRVRFLSPPQIFRPLWIHVHAPAYEYLHLYLHLLFTELSIRVIRQVGPLLRHASHDTLKISESPTNLFELFFGSSDAEYKSFLGRCSGRGVSTRLDNEVDIDSDLLPVDLSCTTARGCSVKELKTSLIRTVDISSARLSGAVAFSGHGPPSTLLGPLTLVDKLVLAALVNGVSDFANMRCMFPTLLEVELKHLPLEPVPSARDWLRHNGAPLCKYLSSRKAQGSALAHLAAAEAYVDVLDDLRRFCAEVSRRRAIRELRLREQSREIFSIVALWLKR